MPEIAQWGLIFAVSLFFLIKSADYFIEAAEKIGLALGIPSFIIGVTIVALGTSIPELASSIVAVQKGTTEIVVSNVVGSNITNVFLVLGVILLISQGNKVRMEYSRSDAALLIGSAGLLAFCAWDGQFTTIEACACLVGLALYLFSYIRKYRLDKADDTPEEIADRPSLTVTPFLILAASIAGIYFSAEYNIEAIIKIAEILDIGTEIIALSAVALGTSLPELFVSIAAVRKGQTEMAIGNVLGSNILNVLVVMGIPGLLSTLDIPSVVLSLSIPLFLLATLSLFLVLRFKRMDWWSGVLLLCMYGFFFYQLVAQNMG